MSDHSRGQALPPANPLSTNGNNAKTIVIPDIISRKRKENIRNLRRKAGMPPHWRECEAPLRRTQRDGADETIGRILSHPLLWTTHARHRSNLQRKKQHRHSGIFRVADLGPGTMPRGKYPESPAPAGSHALISRTPTPGGMLHANLGLPRPPPRNFQPPLPRFPSRLSPRWMSGTTVGRILSHPLPRRHAWLAGPPANTCSRNGSQSNRKRIPQNKNLLVPSLLRRHACLTTPVVNTCSRNGSQSNRKRIPKTKN